MSAASTVTAEALATAAARAQRAWERAGVRPRLRALQAASARLLAGRAAFLDGLRGDGFSEALAAYWGGFALHLADRDLLERHAAELVRSITSDRGRELLVRRPDGVVLLVLPANAPTVNAMAVWSILLAGNAVVVRAPERDAGVRGLVEAVIWPALEAAGFSRDLASVVTGKTREVLDAFDSVASVRTVVFFGNSSAGREVAARGLARGRKVVLELEGNDCMLVWRDAPIERAAEDAARAFHASTQLCLVPKQLLVHHDAAPAFAHALVARARASTVSVAADPAHGVLAPVGRMDAYFTALAELAALGEVLCGGQRIGPTGERDERGAYLAPTIVALDAERLEQARPACLREEIFFPLLVLIRFGGTDPCAAMCRYVEESPFGLRASVWTHDPAVLASCARELATVGLLLLNDEHGRVPFHVPPWGGTRRSGGPHGESHFYWEKTSHLQSIVCTDMSVTELDSVTSALRGAEP